VAGGRLVSLAYRGLGSVRQHLVENEAARQHLRPVYNWLRRRPTED
jgi:hypothetical protein